MSAIFKLTYSFKQGDMWARPEETTLKSESECMSFLDEMKCEAEKFKTKLRYRIVNVDILYEGIYEYKNNGGHEK